MPVETEVNAMSPQHCPHCGRDLGADAVRCADCGCELNGAALGSAATGSQQASPPVPPSEKLSPEVLEWLRQQTNPEEILAEIREIEETGGLELKDFLPEIEKELYGRP